MEMILPLMRAYRYAYYKIYTGIRSIRVSDTSHWTAGFILTTIVFFNILSVALLPVVALGRAGMFLSGEALNGVWVVVLAVNYFLFIRGGRIELLAEEFGEESQDQSRKGSRRVWGYVAGSVLLFLALNVVKVILWGEP